MDSVEKVNILYKGIYQVPAAVQWIILIAIVLLIAGVILFIRKKRK